MKKLLMIGALILSGCSSFDSELTRKPLEVNRAIITVESGENLSSFHHLGEAHWKDFDGVRYCTIRLRDYPHGLGHEADHCFRGKWHGEKPNGQDF